MSPRFAAAIENGTRSSDGSPGARYWTQYTHYDLRVRLMPDQKQLEGQARIRYENRSPDVLNALHLELSLNVHAPGAVRNERMDTSPPVRIDRVAVAGRELSAGTEMGPRYAIRGTHLAVVPHEAVQPGSSADIEIHWALDVPQHGAGGRMGYVPDELFFLAYWYPTMAVYDDVNGWHTDPFRGNAEFYHGFGDYDVTILAPAGWLIRATGQQTNESEALSARTLERLDAARRSDTVVRIAGPDETASITVAGDSEGFVPWRFRAEGVRDFSFSATTRSTWEAARTPVGDRDGDGEVDYTLFEALYRTSAPLWKNMVDYGQYATRFLSEYTGYPYPWPHMTAVEASPIEASGMEYPMMTMIGDYNRAGDSLLYAVTAHEIAHQWIPMIVGQNERRYGWMDEGITTFAENASKLARNPQSVDRLNELTAYMLRARRGDESAIMTWSDFHTPLNADVVAVYYKPSTLFVALQEILGKDVFLDAYRTFIREWSFKHPYPEDLFATFERVSSRDLSWFWTPWFYQKWTMDQRIVRVRQFTDHIMVEVESLGLAPMPVLLEVELADRSILERRFEAEDLWLSGRDRAMLRIPVDQPAIRVEIDPERLFPDLERSNNVWWADTAGR